MDSFNHDNQADVIEAFNWTSRYLDDILNIDRYGQSNQGAKSLYLAKKVGGDISCYCCFECILDSSDLPKEGLSVL